MGSTRRRSPGDQYDNRTGKCTAISGSLPIQRSKSTTWIASICDMILKDMPCKSPLRRLYSAGSLFLIVGLLLAADTFTGEEYAVYSAALANIRFSHADRGESLAIVRDTIALRELPVPTEDCSSLPVALRHRMEEVLVVNRGLPVSSSRTLADKKLAIGRPYYVSHSATGGRMAPTEIFAWDSHRSARRRNCRSVSWHKSSGPAQQCFV